MHPATKDVSEKVNANAIITSIRNLCSTRMYESPFHPEISSQIYDLLFEPLTPTVAATLKKVITYVINNFEPRANILYLDVKDSPENNSIMIILWFNIIGTTNTIKTSFFLERTL